MSSKGPLNPELIHSGGNSSDENVAATAAAAVGGSSAQQPPRRSRSSSSNRKRAHQHASASGAEYRPRSRGTPFRGGGYSTDYEPPMSSRSMKSTRPFRYEEREEWDDEDYYYERDRNYWRDRERERDEPQHPDRYARRQMREHSRPPRAWRNRGLGEEGEMGSPGTPSKQYFEETQRRIQDEEMGYGAGGGGGGGGRLNWKELSKEEKVEVLRLPLTEWMNSEFKNHFVASLGEFIGTTLFLLFAFAGTEVANIQSQANQSDSNDSNTTTGGATGFNIAVLLYISLIFGFSLMVNVWIFFRISGGLFNPAVTLAMLLVRAIPPIRAACLFLAQILGSLLASVIVRYLFPETFNVRTTLSGGTSIVQGVFIEAVLTAELVFTIFMLAKEKHKATFIAPVGIGLALFIAEMVGVQFTGGSLNPARSFGPCVVTATFDKEHWIYWVGPTIGALFAVVFYRFIKTLEYEVSPGAVMMPIRPAPRCLQTANMSNRWPTRVLMAIRSTTRPKILRRGLRSGVRGGCRPRVSPARYRAVAWTRAHV